MSVAMEMSDTVLQRKDFILLLSEFKSFSKSEIQERQFDRIVAKNQFDLIGFLQKKCHNRGFPK